MRNFLTFIALPLVAFGCGNHATTKPAEPPAPPQTTAVEAPAPKPKFDGKSVAVSSDLMTACNVTVGNPDRAPKFAFDENALLPEDREVLSQVATCITSGPLKGRSLKLVGRTDARGESEYNMSLGAHRAGSVQAYLVQLGVDKAKLAETSRGKLDATGTDETGWEKDRRVDLILQ